MRSNGFVLGSVAFVTLALSACGTIVNGGSQTVDVIVKGSPSAHCEFTTSKFRNAGTYPNKMTIERSHENLTAECRGEQNRFTKFEVPSVMTASGTIGNVPNGAIPGISYDAMSGGLWTYPDPIIVDFRQDYTAADKKPAWPTDTVDSDIDTTRVGTANIAAPKPVRMQPVLDEQLNPALPATHAPVAKTEIIDAVRLATDNPAPVARVDTVTTTTAPSATMAPAKITPMKPIISSEDDPEVMKAKAEAKRKAAAQAKAKKEAEAKKRAEEEAAAKAAAEAAEAAAAAEKAAAEAAEAARAAEAAAAAQQAAPAPAAETAPTTSVPPSGGTLPETTATPPAEPAPAAQTPAATEPEAGPVEGESVDKKQYLEGQ